MDLVLLIQYRGVQGRGWQRQKDRPSIQGYLEDALSQVEGRRVKLKGASRTDAGVHARMQVGACEVSRPLSPMRWVKALNGLLPDDIRVRWAGFSEKPFSPRRFCTPKLYVYRFYFSPTPDPFLDPFAYRVSEEFPEDRILPFLDFLRGVEDFSSARKRRANPNAFTRRPLLGVEYSKKGIVAELRLKGVSFLTHEVRILAGTFLALAQGRKTLDEVVRAFASGRREGLGPTLPPYGLTLEWVKIPEWNWVDPWPTLVPECSITG